jgi:D-serine deaminase-like pyridoxal phosphate-dependent protein
MPRRPPARVGDAVEAIDTPALVVDLDALERNVAAMAAYARAVGLRLRPHAKTHKCAAIARLQRAAGAVGVCVQKVDEALALAAEGVDDILITNEVVSPAKLARLAELAVRVRVAIAVDSIVGIDRLARAMAARRPIDVFVEIDVGHHRCGAEAKDAAALARHVCGHPALRFAGLQAYHGSAQHFRTREERREAIARSTEITARARHDIEAAGIPVPLVTGAGTGSFPLEGASGVWGEIQPGSYVFMDRDYGENERLDESPRFAHSLFLKSQVMSRSADRAVIDAGHKSHALDSGPPMVWASALAWSTGGDEHGLLHAAGGEPLPAIGEPVWLVPGHCDPTVNLHDHLVAVRGGLDAGRVEAVWPVDARGAYG